MWHRRFRIASAVVEVTCAAPQLLERFTALTAPYAPEAAAEPTLIFRLDVVDAQFALHCRSGFGEQLLWRSHDADDMPPALEIHLYSQLMAQLYPQALSLHAAAVSHAERVALFAGVSGAGKSSLCTAALLAGAGYCSDEFALLGEDRLLAPFPRPLQWEHLQHSAFTAEQMAAGGFECVRFDFPDPQGARIVSQLWLPPLIERRALPPLALFLPRYAAAAPPAALRELRRSEGLMQLAMHLHHQLPPAEAVRQLNRRLPEECRCWRLDFSDARAGWSAAAAAMAEGD